MRCTAQFIRPVVALVISSSAIGAQPHRGDDLRTMITARETALWESVKSRDTALFAKALADEYVGVYDSAIAGRADEIKGVSAFSLTSYSLDSVRVRRVDPSNAIITYTIAVNGAMGGKSITGNYHTLSLWHHTGKRWLTVAHTEVKAP